jgi:hypothetical protein
MAIDAVSLRRSSASVSIAVRRAAAFASAPAPEIGLMIAAILTGSLL